jgi:tRNA pseudouridine38-40 synthase
MSYWHPISHHRRGVIVCAPLDLSNGLTAPQLYGPREVLVPKMPALGLLLENPIFDSYNTKIASVNAKLQPTDADYRPPIDFEVHRDKMEKFKQEFIYDNMRNVEDRDGM